MTSEQWAHENIEGAENDSIECVWEDSVMTLVINDEEVESTDYLTAPDSKELRVSWEIDAINFWYAYNG